MNIFEQLTLYCILHRVELKMLTIEKTHQLERGLPDPLALRGLRDTLLVYLDFLFGHALQSLLPILMHMDMELIQPTFWLDVGAIWLQNVSITTRLLQRKAIRIRLILKL